MEILIRNYKEDDLSEIIKFDPDFMIILNEVEKKRKIKVAIVEKMVVGYSILLIGQESAYFDDNGMNWAEIQELHVHPKYQHMGVGTKLVKTLLKVANDFEISNVYVCTDDFNKTAQELYSKCGFKEFNKIIRYKVSL